MTEHQVNNRLARDLFSQAYTRVLGRLSTPYQTFLAGVFIGQAEKVWLGACPAFMVSVEEIDFEREEVCGVLRRIAEIYDLHLLYLADQKEWWLFRSEVRDSALRLEWMEPNKEQWHLLRAALCGIPLERVDYHYHR